MSNLYQAATHLVSYTLFATAIGFTGAGLSNLEQRSAKVSLPAPARAEPEVNVGEITVVPPKPTAKPAVAPPVAPPAAPPVAPRALAPKPVVAAKPIPASTPAPEPALNGMHRTCEDRVMNGSGDKVKICTWRY